MIGTGGFLVLAASFSTLAPAALFIGGVGACAGTTYVTGFTVLQENVSDELRGRTFATLYTVVRLCLLISLTISPLWADFWNWVTEGLFTDQTVHDRAVQLRAPRCPHRALGRRHHHVRRRVRGVAVDPQGGAARGGEWRGAAGARGSVRADPPARPGRAVAGGADRPMRARHRPTPDHDDDAPEAGAAP